jgi:hypothetical protein
MKNILLVTMLLAFISLGLAACSSPLDADNVIDQKSYDAAIETCGDSIGCPWDKVFVPKINDYCNRNNLTEDQCNQLSVNAVLKYGDYTKREAEKIRNLRIDLEERIRNYERSK